MASVGVNPRAGALRFRRIQRPFEAAATRSRRLCQGAGSLGVIILVSSAAALIAFRLNMPGGLIVGAMAASGVLHGSGAVHAFLPVPVAICSFIVMGAMIGTRLGGADIRQLARLGLVGIGALLVGTTVGCLFAAVVAWSLNLRLADVVMAYAPGAIEAMTIIAFALHLDPVFVGVHHLARFTFMSLVLPAAVGLIKAWEGKTGKEPLPFQVLRSFPRKRESRAKNWVPAFAGTSGPQATPPPSRGCRTAIRAAATHRPAPRQACRSAHPRDTARA